VRIATWNVNSITARLPRLLDWLAATAPDAVCLQETKIADAAFPAGDVEALGYQVAAHGDGRWNGVALLSKVGLDDVARGLIGEPGYPDPEARAVGATCGGVRLWSVYVPNGREPGHDHYAYKLAWLATLGTTVTADLTTYEKLVVMGDFNVAPTDDDVWDRAAFEGSTHVTDWDYRAGNFHKNLGMRIDLVYATPPVATAVTDAYVDRDARKGKGPSDHAPVVVDLDL
jgi:exodeoxyribonuclease-3